MSNVVKSAVVAAMVVAGLSAPRQAAAYSVLAHEANIDALWDNTIAPMLRTRFPEASPEQIQEARGYAYGGCVIQDLGYYPFGSHFFSNLLHYVRSGDFIDALIRDAQDVDEYAFALGALGHYSADNEGHPLAVNPAVSLMYPKLRAKFGNAVTYEQSPKNHVLVEFSFDVVQVASGAYAPEAYHSFIGFKVAKPLLERAFSETYGIEMKEIFLNEDLAIGTYRHAVATTIPGMTKVAWGKKRDAIRNVIQPPPPGVREGVRRRLREGSRVRALPRLHVPSDPEDRSVSRPQLLGADAGGRTTVLDEFHSDQRALQTVARCCERREPASRQHRL
jgi:hypothetical protein